jgi:hypothetical protein
MCNEKKDEEQEQKTLQDKHEELRRWFESIGDCV